MSGPASPNRGALGQPSARSWRSTVRTATVSVKAVLNAREDAHVGARRLDDRGRRRQLRRCPSGRRAHFATTATVQFRLLNINTRPALESFMRSRQGSSLRFARKALVSAGREGLLLAGGSGSRDDPAATRRPECRVAWSGVLTVLLLPFHRSSRRSVALDGLPEAAAPFPPGDAELSAAPRMTVGGLPRSGNLASRAPARPR